MPDAVAARKRGMRASLRDLWACAWIRRGPAPRIDLPHGRYLKECRGAGVGRRGVERQRARTVVVVPAAREPGAASEPRIRPRRGIDSQSKRRRKSLGVGPLYPSRRVIPVARRMLQCRTGLRGRDEVCCKSMASNRAPGKSQCYLCNTNPKTGRRECIAAVPLLRVHHC